MNFRGIDIFGRTLEQYQHLCKIRNKGMLIPELNARCAEYQARCGLPPIPHLFSKGIPDLALGAEGGLGWITNNMQAIVSMTEEILYRGSQLNELVPMRVGIQEGARTYGVRVRDTRGKGRLISDAGSDLPTVGTNRSLVSASLYTGGYAITFSEEDVRNARYAGIPLQEEQVVSGTNAYVSHMEDVGFIGDIDLPDSTGLLNQPYAGDNATASRTESHATNTWIPSGANDLTLDDKVRLIQSSISNIIRNTEEIFTTVRQTGELCVLLPADIFDDIHNEGYGDNRDKTVAEFLMMANPWKRRTGKDIKFVSLSLLDEEGYANAADRAAGLTSRKRIVTYIMDIEVIEMANVFGPRLHPPQLRNLNIVIPAEYKYGTFQVKRSGVIEYLDTR